VSGPGRGGSVSIVGIQGGRAFGAGAETALVEADVIIGAGRHLNALPAHLAGRHQTLSGPLELVLTQVEAAADRGQQVAVLTSGDPGFFGLVRLAASRLGAERLAVHPAPSAVSLAFARLGESWDDAQVVSAHGRPLGAAVDAITAADRPGSGAARITKVAVLVSPDQPPEALGRALLAQGCPPKRVAVCSRLAEEDESVTHTDLAGLAAGIWDPLSVVVLRAAEPGPSAARLAWSAQAAPPVRAWGRPDEAYAHRAGMITKAEVRAVVLAKLALPAAGVFWDVGAGSGAVSADVAALAPGLSVHAVERRSDDAERIRQNTMGSPVDIVEGEAPDALRALPDPDRAFVGGGGIDVLDAVIRRLRPGGVVVATYAALDRAAAAAPRLGHLVQVSVSRGVAIGPGGALRLQAENPVFVCWGPGA
jgi:precorrin-6B C5,15-methyltransferase / cobalt-precorrin-6B C5,C15-methyltransferase